MLNIGIVIAASVLVIYLILGPIVILGIYAFFDRMAENAENMNQEGVNKNLSPDDKDPALWSEQDVRGYLTKNRYFREKNRSDDPYHL